MGILTRLLSWFGLRPAARSGRASRSSLRLRQTSVSGSARASPPAGDDPLRTGEPSKLLWELAKERGLSIEQLLQEDKDVLRRVARPHRDCATPAEVEAYFRQPEALSAERRAHLEGCARCRRILVAARPTPDVIASLARAAAQPQQDLTRKMVEFVRLELLRSRVLPLVQAFWREGSGQQGAGSDAPLRAAVDRLVETAPMWGDLTPAAQHELYAEVARRLRQLLLERELDEPPTPPPQPAPRSAALAQGGVHGRSRPSDREAEGLRFQRSGPVNRLPLPVRWQEANPEQVLIFDLGWFAQRTPDQIGELLGLNQEDVTDKLRAAEAHFFG